MRTTLTITLAFVALAGVISGCQERNNWNNKPRNKTSIGKVKDVSVIPTSSNERIKTQIKTDSLFFAVYDIPTVKIGSIIYGYSENNVLDEVIDANGISYTVVK